MALETGRAQVSAPAQSLVDNGILFTANNPIEKFCAVGDPMIIEWKGVRYRTLMRGVKMEVVATNLAGQKARLAVLQETSFILADMPKNYAAAAFEFNSPLTIRFLRDGKVYTLRTRLMRVHSQPPLMVLEYPEKLEFHNMRSDERVGIIFPARIFGDDDMEDKMGAVLDISPTGARIGLAAVNGIKEGGKLNLSFTLPSGAAVGNLAVTVRNISEESGKYLLGTKFFAQDAAVSRFCRECSDCLE